VALNPGGITSGNKGVQQFWFLLVGLAGALVLIGVTMASYIANDHHHKTSTYLNPYLAGIIVIAFGVAGQVLVRIVDPPLNGSTDASLVATYRQRFFLWVGVGEAPAFIGLVAALVTNNFWLYLVGVVFAVLSYVRIAPSARNLARDQRRLNQSGSSLSLVSALASMPARRSRR
jgi:hypothetical protein